MITIPKSFWNYWSKQYWDYWEKQHLCGEGHSWPCPSEEWLIWSFLKWQAKNPCWDCNCNIEHMDCPGIKEGCKIREYKRRYLRADKK